jgi:hypothetical protein
VCCANYEAGASPYHICLCCGILLQLACCKTRERMVKIQRAQLFGTICLPKDQATLYLRLSGSFWPSPSSFALRWLSSERYLHPCTPYSLTQKRSPPSQRPSCTCGPSPTQPDLSTPNILKMWRWDASLMSTICSADNTVASFRSCVELQKQKPIQDTHCSS